MKPLTEMQASKWKKTRELGVRRFTLINGVLMWGLPAGIVWAIAMAAIQGWNRLPAFLVLSMIAFPLGGIFYGRLMWRIFEARYAVPRNSKRCDKKGTRSASRRG